MAESGRPFESLDLDVDEMVEEELPPEAYARCLAERKAMAGAATLSAGWVLGADTIVVVGGRILGKPASRDEARAMLGRLSGTRHEVITGVCLCDAGTGARIVEAGVTEIVMRPMDPAEVDAYVDSGESDGKAGAYAIQETGDRFVERIDGSYTNVVGLPMELLDRMLQEAGVE